MPKKAVKNESEEKVDTLFLENQELKERIKELEKKPTRKDHEIIYDGQHYFINFNELMKLMDAIARGSRYMNMYQGPRGAWNALANILSLQTPEHSGLEEARELILKYAGQ